MTSPTQTIKQRTREIARSVLEQLPAPGSPEAKDLAAQLSKSGNWHFRRKQRLDPNQSEFQSLDDWLSFVRSDEGVRNAGGGITRYALADEIDEIDLVEEVRQMARIFRPLMERVVADAPPTTAPRPVAPTTPTVPRCLQRCCQPSVICSGPSCANSLKRVADLSKRPIRSGMPCRM